MATKDVSDLQVVQAYSMPNHAGSMYPHERLAQETGESLKVCWRACQRAAERGYIDHGVTLRAGWVTAKGRELLCPGSK